MEKKMILHKADVVVILKKSLFYKFYSPFCYKTWPCINYTFSTLQDKLTFSSKVLIVRVLVFKKTFT